MFTDTPMQEIAKLVFDKFGRCDLRIVRVEGRWYAAIQQGIKIHTWSGKTPVEALSNLLTTPAPHTNTGTHDLQADANAIERAWATYRISRAIRDQQDPGT